MADHEKLPFHELSAINQQILATAYWPMDYYFDNLRKTISAIQSGGSEFGEKMKACADKNVSLTQEFARQLRQPRTYKRSIASRRTLCRKCCGRLRSKRSSPAMVLKRRSQRSKRLFARDQNLGGCWRKGTGWPA
jgi:hypothetical protein